MFRDYRHEAAKNAMLGAVAIVALLFVSLRSTRRVLEVSLPLVAAVVAVTTWLILGGQLNLAHDLDPDLADDLAARLGRGAADFAEKNFSWRRSAEALAKFHRSLAPS